jgi:uncharacterized protein (UPF0548 family)
MIGLVRPTPATIAAQLHDTKAAFSYAEVGATARPAELAALADRYTFDHSRFPLGQGREVFERARVALFAWRHFEIPWLELHGEARPAPPVRAGQDVATLTRVFGLWFLNPCRVVDRIEPPGETNEVSFAYGTLAGHVAQGEERFTVRRHPATDEVVFEIFAFSRPALTLARIGRPWMRRVQKRFAADAAAALRRGITGPAAR